MLLTLKMEKGARNAGGLQKLKKDKEMNSPLGSCAVLSHEFMVICYSDNKKLIPEVTATFQGRNDENLI